MKASVLLRVASVLVLINGVLHTIGGVFGHAAPGIMAETELAMKSNQFVAMGVSRTYWDYYFGYGLSLTVFLLLEAAVFWQLASLVKTDGARLRPMLMSFCVACAVSAVFCWKYFFAGPAVFQLVIAGCLLGAWLNLRDVQGA
jgi:hypothetical protein